MTSNFSGRLTGAVNIPGGGKPGGIYPTGDGMIAGMYDLEETIGKGHYAVVKLARHVFTGERVAVKVIDKMKLDDVSRSHLFQEVRCMKLVQHPHVVRLYEVIDTQTRLYLILEWGDGGDMYDHIMKHDRGLTEDVARRYFSQIVDAINYCHKLHVVHRDLKPENVVFFEKLGVVKLTDFGFSNKFVPGSKLETSCGSLAYSAPEILLGDSYDAPAVDVWSLGVILYMLVCGEAPFREANDSETLTMIMDCRYTLPPHVSEPCRSMIRSMIVKDPNKRARLDEIINHPWMCGDGDTRGVQVPLVISSSLSTEDHSYVVQRMVDGGIASREEIMAALTKQAYNHITATYYLLVERLLRKRGAAEVTGRAAEVPMGVEAMAAAAAVTAVSVAGIAGRSPVRLGSGGGDAALSPLSPVPRSSLESQSLVEASHLPNTPRLWSAFDSLISPPSHQLSPATLPRASPASGAASSSSLSHVKSVSDMTSGPVSYGWAKSSERSLGHLRCPLIHEDSGEYRQDDDEMSQGDDVVCPTTNIQHSASDGRLAGLVSTCSQESDVQSQAKDKSDDQDVVNMSNMSKEQDSVSSSVGKAFEMKTVKDELPASENRTYVVLGSPKKNRIMKPDTTTQLSPARAVMSSTPITHGNISEAVIKQDCEISSSEKPCTENVVRSLDSRTHASRVITGKEDHIPSVSSLVTHPVSSVILSSSVPIKSFDVKHEESHKACSASNQGGSNKESVAVRQDLKDEKISARLAQSDTNKSSTVVEEKLCEENLVKKCSELSVSDSVEMKEGDCCTCNIEPAVKPDHLLLPQSLYAGGVGGGLSVWGGSGSSRPLYNACSSPQLLNEIYEECESEDEDDVSDFPNVTSRARNSMASPEIVRKLERLQQSKRRLSGGAKGLGRVTSCSSSDTSDTDEVIEGQVRRHKHKISVAACAHDDKPGLSRRDSSEHSSDTDGGNGGLAGGSSSGRGCRSSMCRTRGAQTGDRKEEGGRGGEGERGRNRSSHPTQTETDESITFQVSSTQCDNETAFPCSETNYEDVIRDTAKVMIENNFANTAPGSVVLGACCYSIQEEQGDLSHDDSKTVCKPAEVNSLGKFEAVVEKDSVSIFIPAKSGIPEDTSGSVKSSGICSKLETVSERPMIGDMIRSASDDVVDELTCLNVVRRRLSEGFTRRMPGTGSAPSSRRVSPLGRHGGYPTPPQSCQSEVIRMRSQTFTELVQKVEDEAESAAISRSEFLRRLSFRQQNEGRRLKYVVERNNEELTQPLLNFMSFRQQNRKISA